jgi:hypothetical protein
LSSPPTSPSPTITTTTFCTAGQTKSTCLLLNSPNIKEFVKAAWANRQHAGNGSAFEQAMHAGDELNRNYAQGSKGELLIEFPRLRDLLPLIYCAMDSVLSTGMWEGGNPKRGLKKAHYGCEVGWDEKDGVYYKNQATGDRSYYLVGPFGFETIFAYLFLAGMPNFEFAQGVVDKNIGISVNTGHFLYSQIPKAFAHKLALTGTLIALSKPEKKILQVS